LIPLFVVKYLYARSELSFDLTIFKVTMRYALRVSAGLFVSTATGLLDMQTRLHIVASKGREIIVVNLFGGTEFLILIFIFR